MYISVLSRLRIEPSKNGVKKVRKDKSISKKGSTKVKTEPTTWDPDVWSRLGDRAVDRGRRIEGDINIIATNRERTEYRLRCGLAEADRSVPGDRSLETLGAVSNLITLNLANLVDLKDDDLNQNHPLFKVSVFDANLYCPMLCNLYTHAIKRCSALWCHPSNTH